LGKEVKPGTIEGDKPENLIRKEPYPLPSEFEWCLINIDDEAEVILRIITI
jgi:glycylpeptide N-tetradecanoyltransferase